jgi:polyketide biosynthesis acyl carrier protein
MNKTDIFALVARQTCDVIPSLKDHVFQRSDRLKDLGANSIDRSEIIEMTMESLSLNIPRVAVFGARNIGELVDVLHEKLLIDRAS